MTTGDGGIIGIAKDVLKTEAEAVLGLISKLGSRKYSESMED